MERIQEEVALLVGQTGPLNGQRWELRENLILGRENSCDIVIHDRQISRHHARLTVTPRGVLLEDLGSKNGTHHNGQNVNEPIVLQDGDIIQVALAQKFIFLSSDSTVPLEPQETDMIAFYPSPGERKTDINIERLKLEKRSRRVWLRIRGDDNSIREVEIIPPLSVSQFCLLEQLYENQERVVTRFELVDAVWGEIQAFDVSEQALDALVRRLRERIANIDPDHTYIVTVRGHGLRLDNSEL
jgi:hypothetical protein